MKQFILLLSICLFLFNLGCEDDEQKKLGEAQACLDNAPEDSPSAAAACFSYISGVNTPQADALRCSIGFLAAGVNTDKIVQAVKRLDTGSNAEEVFVSLLVFNGVNSADSTENANGSQAIDNVTATASYCNSSGVKGLMYLGNFAVTGTAIVRSINSDSDTSFWEAPELNSATLEDDINGAVADCSTDSSGCSPEAVGSAIISLGDSYCLGKEDDKQCQQVAAAIAAGGGDSSAVGEAFFTELNKD